MIIIVILLFIMIRFFTSFGQMAIFLIGGPSINDKPSAVFLRSGDIAVMSKSSRLSYHAVPRIMKSDIPPSWRTTMENTSNAQEDNPNEDAIQAKRRKTDFPETDINQQLDKTKLDGQLWKDTLDDDAFWRPFDEYVKECRININVRQVLCRGQISLGDDNEKPVQNSQNNCENIIINE